MLTVVKVGGSLAREGGGASLADLCQEIGRLGGSWSLLLVPGGGAFADVVRDHNHRFHLGETTAHWMALLAMDQYGYLLGDLVPGGILSRALLSAQRATARGRTPILLPSALLLEADPLPHSWRVTSDSIAAWVAGLTRAARLVLLKDVDGLFLDGPGLGEFVSHLTVHELESLRRSGQLGGVDEHLPAILAGMELEVWVINGRHPKRLAHLLAGARTLGTRIAPAQRAGPARDG